MKIGMTSTRRTFLKGAAFFSAWTLFGLRRSAVEAGPPSKPQQETSEKGYRLTEHVKKYYDTARL